MEGYTPVPFNWICYQEAPTNNYKKTCTVVVLFLCAWFIPVVEFRWCGACGDISGRKRHSHCHGATKSTWKGAILVLSWKRSYMAAFYLIWTVFYRYCQFCFSPLASFYFFLGSSSLLSLFPLSISPPPPTVGASYQCYWDELMLWKS